MDCWHVLGLLVVLVVLTRVEGAGGVVWVGRVLR